MVTRPLYVTKVCLDEAENGVWLEVRLMDGEGAKRENCVKVDQVSPDRVARALEEQARWLRAQE